MKLLLIFGIVGITIITTGCSQKYEVIGENEKDRKFRAFVSERFASVDRMKNRTSRVTMQNKSKTIDRNDIFYNQLYGADQ